MANKKKQFTLEDGAHFIIYRELDKLGVKDPFKNATLICTELRESVEYRKRIKR